MNKIYIVLSKVLIMKSLILLIIFIHGSVSMIAQNDLIIVGLQMNVSRSIAENERTIIRHLNSLKDRNVDFLITPEGSLSGYTSEFNGQELKESLAKVVSAAKSVNIGLILGTCYKDTVNSKEYCYN